MEKLRNLDKEQKIGLTIIILLGLVLVAGLVTFYMLLGEASKDADWIPFDDEPIIIKPSPTPTNSSTAIDPYVVSGEMDFTYSGSTLIQKDYTVTNNLDSALSFRVKAVYTVGSVLNLSWDKTEATVPGYSSVTFRLSLLPSGSGSCVINIYKT